ncbi:MAG: hypothetical protein K2X29_08140, partial [Candidatus Obscuribacterales bacterium]|nr:hypothetical protein [Candidatus Obscuribacterales bacterium]
MESVSGQSVLLVRFYACDKIAGDLASEPMTATEYPPLSKGLIERIFLKLGLSECPSLDLDGLGIIYDAWCDMVPFDNSRKLIHLKL